MRPTRRLAVSAALLGGAMLFAAPAAAQEADEYPADQPIGGGIQQPATDEDQDGSQGGGSAGGGGGGGAGAGTASETTVNAATLPFTGGEVTLIALAGAAALGSGVALTAAGRKRSTV